ncbi:MAG: MerR family transcriptional regulator [Stackebrandtia sp.]
MDTPASWTVEELARRAAAALADGSAAPASGRVRETPDVRSIRWYATIGVVDKPAEYRGRTALYGPRHLRQLVAVKRRQAEGASLADIQVELAGVSEKRLAEIARVPDELLDRAEPTDEPAVDAFWRTRAADDKDAATRTDVNTTLSYGIPVGDVTVLIDASRTPNQADIAAVRDAAEPLLRVLHARGLLQGGPRR